MIHFINIFFNYIVGAVAAIFGFFILRKNATLKEENEKINNENLNLEQHLKQEVKINNEIREKTASIKRLKYAGNSKRMRKNHKNKNML